MNLKKAIKELKLDANDEIYIHAYQKDDYTKDPIPVSEITTAMLKKEVLLVQPNHGGQEHGYKHLMFIVR